MALRQVKLYPILVCLTASPQARIMACSTTTAPSHARYLPLLLLVGLASAAALAPRPTRRTLVSCGAAAAASSLARPASATLSRDGYPVQRSYADWTKALSEQQFFVLREGGTEPPFTSPFLREKGKGTFRCAGCDAALFDARQKFDSGTGWPSFAKALPAVEVIDGVGGLAQTALLGAEARCGTCGGHLGDLFLDGFLWPGQAAFLTGKRYCIDGVRMRWRTCAPSSQAPNSFCSRWSSTAGALSSGYLAAAGGARLRAGGRSRGARVRRGLCRRQAVHREQRGHDVARRDVIR